MIDPHSDVFSDLLNRNVRYEVPPNQRPYTWKKEQIDDLLEDLESSKDGSPAPYLGSFILDISKQSEGKLEIVDGQQRLTTLFIFLMACRDHALKLGEHGLSTTIQNVLTFVEMHTSKSKGPRLIASESIRLLLDHMSDSGWNKLPKEEQFPPKLGTHHIKLQVRQLQPIYNSFRRKLDPYNLMQLQQILATVYGIRLTRIQIDHEEEAFSIFERTNARGVDLAISDLMQNFLFERERPELRKEWEHIRKNAGSGVLRMLKGFYTSQKGYVKKVRLYRCLKSYSVELKGVDRLVERMQQYSEFFRCYRHLEKDADVRKYFADIDFSGLASDAQRTDQCFVHLQGLQLFNIQQAVPLLYAGLQCVLRTMDKSSKSAADGFLRLAALLENYHFVNNAICERVGNEIEKTYADYCVRFASSSNFIDSLNDLHGTLRKKKASKDEFETRFCEISYASSSSELSLIAYIFDREANYGRKAGERMRLFRPEKDLKRRQYNIEHIFPRKPRSGPGLETDALDNIGNLMLISVGPNSSLQNETPAEKIVSLEGRLAPKVENTTQVRKFIKDWRDRATSWDARAIEDRARSMAREAYDKIWTF